MLIPYYNIYMLIPYNNIYMLIPYATGDSPVLRVLLSWHKVLNPLFVNPLCSYIYVDPLKNVNPLYTLLLTLIPYMQVSFNVGLQAGELQRTLAVAANLVSSICVCVYIYMVVYVFMRVYMYIYVFICIYMYIYVSLTHYTL
jgi:hypothetical protein